MNTPSNYTHWRFNEEVGQRFSDAMYRLNGLDYRYIWKDFICVGRDIYFGDAIICRIVAGSSPSIDWRISTEGTEPVRIALDTFIKHVIESVDKIKEKETLKMQRQREKERVKLIKLANKYVNLEAEK